jgi:hypothetical protein
MIDFDDNVSEQPSERPGYNRKLSEAWSKAERQYSRAGLPFGPSVRALEVWIEYGRTTTVN